MRLKNDIQRNKDFIIVNQTIWMKIKKYFGGAPEIGFYLVDKKLLANNLGDYIYGLENSQMHDSMLTDDSNQKELPDLNPITLKVYVLDGQEKHMKGVLVSKHIGIKNFLNSISGQFGFGPTKVNMYKAWVDRTTEEVNYEHI